MVDRTKSETSLIEQGGARDRTDQPQWLIELATAGGHAFAEHGLPHRRQEDWKYTDLRAKLRCDFVSAQPMDPGPDMGQEDLLADLDCHRITLVNGFFEAGLSNIAGLPQGVEIQSFAEALLNAPDLLQAYVGRSEALEGHAMVGLNSALMSDGFVIVIEQNVRLNRPIHVCHMVSGDQEISQFSRNLIIAKEGAYASLVESFAGPSATAYLSNVVTEIFAEPSAVLHHYKFQVEGDQASHLDTVAVTLQAEANYSSATLSLGGALVRNEVFVRFAGEGAATSLNGAFLLSGRQHCDTTTKVDHAVPHCQSDEVFRGVMMDSARGVFQGKISVRPQAQKTDARMMTKALLLSDRAEMDSKPELEIYADDVKCAHGATVGTLDDEALFYLMSRGIDPETARTLLITAFIEEPLDLIVDEMIRDAFDRAIEQALGRRAAL